MEDSNSKVQVPIFIKTEDLHLYRNSKFVDVRDVDSYNVSHIKNAVNANDLFTYLLSKSTKDEIENMKLYFQKRFSELGIHEHEHVIVYEQSMDNQYGASCRGFFILKFMGHCLVSTLEGGFDSLVRMENGTDYITNESTIISPCNYHVHSNVQNEWQMVGQDEIVHFVIDKPSKVCLLDVRDSDEWNGLSSSPYGADFTPRKGRIPGAKWIEWYLFHELDDNKNVTQLKSNEQIQHLMAQNGIFKDDQIIIYCFKGSRAAVVLMQLKRAGYDNVKNYFSSWNEWSRDFNLPIDDRVF